MMEAERRSEGWLDLNFGEMATHVSERVDDPKLAGVDIYVGLEHLDPGDLRIRRRGTPDDVAAQKLRVRPGQIIFGKRRAYQRKVAVANFDGICSAHAMVLEEKPTLFPGFLPYFMQSDEFMDRAVKISEGGLSPTIKWKTMAAQRFLLPPLEQQREIVELMQGFEAAIEASDTVLEATNSLFESLLKESFTAPEGESFTELCEIRNGLNFSGDQRGSGIPVIDITAIQGNSIYPSMESLYSVNTTMSPEDYLKQGDILIIRSHANKHRVGLSVVIENLEAEASFSGFLIRARPDQERFLSRYLTYFLRSPDARRTIFERAGGTNINNISRSTLAALRVPSISIGEQREILKRLDATSDQIVSFTRHGDAIRRVKLSVLNTILTPAIPAPTLVQA